MSPVVPFDLDAGIARPERQHPGFGWRVEVLVAMMRLEQDLIGLREARGLSPAQLAHRIGVTRQAVQAAE
jgi:ribosome-binding protein aMBF1 (putative translation factor)